MLKLTVIGIFAQLSPISSTVEFLVITGQDQVIIPTIYWAVTVVQYGVSLPLGPILCCIVKEHVPSVETMYNK